MYGKRVDVNEPRLIDSDSIDGAWDAWRNRELNALLLAVCILGAPMIIPGLMGEAGLQPLWRLPGIAIYLLAVLTAIAPRWGFRIRSWVLVGLAYLTASVALANRGLLGYGRIGLAVYPCWIAILMGSRAGWGAVGASLGIYGAFAVLSVMGVFRDWQTASAEPVAPMFWVMQALGLGLGMVPGVILLSRFRVHHMRILDAERRTSGQLHEEIAQRTAAYESLDREQAERVKLEEKIAQLGEEERRHLGREIHDGLCQQLTAALLRCTALQERLASARAAEAAQAQRLRRLIQEMLDDAYVISKGVWPVGPEPDALVPALATMAQRASEEFGLSCEFRHQGDIAVADSQMAMHLYRIAQEAVSNSARHAKPLRIVVSLRGDANGIVLEMTDDGCGLPDPARLARGMGMNIMTYRARTLGGTLSIARAEGGGTVVCCQVPHARALSSEGAHGGS